MATVILTIVSFILSSIVGGYYKFIDSSEKVEDRSPIPGIIGGVSILLLWLSLFSWWIIGFFNKCEGGYWGTNLYKKI